MVTRRQFLGLLAGATAALVVPALLEPERTFFLPPRGGWRPQDFGDFDTANLRYKAYERYSTAWTDPKAVFGVPADLTERSLEDMLVALRRLTDERGLKIAVKPTHVVIDPKYFAGDTQWFLRTEAADGLKTFQRSKVRFA